MTQRLAVVTGGSSGIGAATGAALAAEGWNVVLVARGEDALAAVRDHIATAGGTVVAEAADASDGESVLALASRVVAAHGVPDAIVNAAGAGEWRFIEDTPPALAARMMSAPYQAAFNVTHAFMGGMLGRGRGVVVHVGSPASFIPWPGATAYTAARWALRGLHEALRQDLAGTGVQSCHVVFGEVSSPYFEHNAVSRDRLPYLSRWIPPVTPRRCAEVIADVIERPRAQVVHPPAVRVLGRLALLFPAAGRRVAAWGVPRR